MKRLLPVTLSVLLTACNLFGSAGSQMSSESSSQAAQLPETHNVSYTGTVEVADADVSSQGSHQLRLQDGRTVVLSSTLLALDDYVSLDVVVFGAVRPTTDGSGVAMRVESVTVLSATYSSEASSSSSEEQSSSQEPTVSSVATEPSSVSSIASVAAAMSSKAPVVSSVSSAAKSSIAPAPVSSAAGISAALDAKVKAMAKEDIAANRWTQQYCTSHIGYCVAVHKNWWFTSFGTSGSALWHLEVSNDEIAGLGDGPLVVNLMPGSVESAGASDGAVTEKNGFVTAYRSWKDNTHFEISAPSALKPAVSYMAQSITSYSPAQ